MTNAQIRIPSVPYSGIGKCRKSCITAMPRMRPGKTSGMVANRSRTQPPGARRTASHAARKVSATASVAVATATSSVLAISST